MRTSSLVILSCSLLLVACGNAAPKQAVTLGEDKKSVQVVTYMPVGDVSNPVHGKVVSMTYGPFNPTGKTRANGVATVHVFEDGQSNVGLQLNIEQPEDGSYYQAWAVQTASSPKSSWISLGSVQSVVGDVRHALKSEQKLSLQNYGLVRVTREPDDGIPAPSGDVVAEAVLKKGNR